MKNFNSLIRAPLTIMAAICMLGACSTVFAQSTGGTTNSGIRLDTPNIVKVITTATTNLTVVNAPVPGQFIPTGVFGVGANPVAPTYIRGWSLTNKAAYPVYLHIYNTATAVTVGTTVDFTTIELLAGATTNQAFGSGQALFLSQGFAFSLSKGFLDTDSTVTVAGDVIGYISWQ